MSQEQDNKIRYTVVLSQPGESIWSSFRFKNLNQAIVYSEAALKEPNRIRSAMIYAIDKNDSHVMVGSIGRDLKWKEAKP